MFKLFLLTAVLSFSSCETIDLNQTKDPSVLSQEALDPTFTFNYVQLQLPQFVSTANDFTQALTRQMAMTSGNTYDNAFGPVNFDNNWFIGYNILNTVKLMEPKAMENHQYYELGASKVIRAYVVMTMVDLYGDIPYSEAIQGGANLNPHFDSSAAIYASVLTELDDAIALLGQTTSVNAARTDLYYKNEASWITLAKTLKLKMYSAARLAGSDIGIADIGAAMTAIINAGDYIDNPSKDFYFQYGNSRDLPNTRHPQYNDQYELGGGAYIANYMMWSMTSEKGTGPGTSYTYFDPTANGGVGANVTATNSVALDTPLDPRVPYYFFKQEPDPSKYSTDTFTLPGRVRPSHYNSPLFASYYDPNVLTPYVVSNWTNTNTVTIPANGYWGRDHGDNSGIPPDSDKRSVIGLYPIGGAYRPYKNTLPISVQQSGTSGAKGAGIMPILLSSYVHFMKSEAIATLGIPGNAKAEFIAGITESIDKSTASIGGYPLLSPVEVNIKAARSAAYLAFMSTKYDAAPGNKLEIIMKEYLIAAMVLSRITITEEPDFQAIFSLH